MLTILSFTSVFKEIVAFSVFQLSRNDSASERLRYDVLWCYALEFLLKYQQMYCHAQEFVISTYVHVLVDHRLKFHVHIRDVIGRAVSRAGKLLLSTLCCSAMFMMSLFISRVKSVMDLCSSTGMWALGSCQAVRVCSEKMDEIFRIEHISNVETLNKLGLFFIDGRLVLINLIKCMKIFHSEDDIGLLNIFSIVVKKRTHGHSLKIVLLKCDCELFFHTCVIQRWSTLPEHVVLQAFT